MDVPVARRHVRDTQLTDLITEIAADLRGIWSCLGAFAVEARAGGAESDESAEEFLCGAVGRLVGRLDAVGQMISGPDDEDEEDAADVLPQLGRARAKLHLISEATP